MVLGAGVLDNNPKIHHWFLYSNTRDLHLENHQVEHIDYQHYQEYNHLTIQLQPDIGFVYYHPLLDFSIGRSH
jgi:hypothetical protein